MNNVRETNTETILVLDMIELDMAQLDTVTGGCEGDAGHDQPSGDNGGSGYNLRDASQLQRALASLGFDPGKIDGIIGPRTRKAIRAFQTQASIGVDGIVGKHTRRALLARLGQA